MPRALRIFNKPQKGIFDEVLMMKRRLECIQPPGCPLIPDHPKRFIRLSKLYMDYYKNLCLFKKDKKDIMLFKLKVDEYHFFGSIKSHGGDEFEAIDETDFKLGYTWIARRIGAWIIVRTEVMQSYFWKLKFYNHKILLTLMWQRRTTTMDDLLQLVPSEHKMFSTRRHVVLLPDSEIEEAEILSKTGVRNYLAEEGLEMKRKKLVKVKEEEPVKRVGKRKKQKARKGISIDKSPQGDSETDKEESVEAMNPTPLDIKSNIVANWKIFQTKGVKKLF
ncbi:hypothetical protein Tco_0824418 [Tanacetum coccineum]|uniref:DUF4283 domain-containing protein n=1 Tax=Tanacetum coccineum TaxID=301880 RepID=A0ABQ5AQP6_9ASTR